MPGSFGQNILNDKTFPTATNNGMAQKVVDGLDMKQGVYDSAIPDINLGRTDQPLSCIGEPWEWKGSSLDIIPLTVPTLSATAASPIVPI